MCSSRRAARGLAVCGSLVLRSRPSRVRLRLLAGVSAPRPTHFLCWCKESKQRKHLEEHAVVAVVSDRYAPAGGARGLAQQALDRATFHQPGESAAGSLAARRGLPLIHQPRRGLGLVRPAPWPWSWRAVASRAVERRLRETARTPGRSAATVDHGHHRMFFQVFLCFLSLHQQRKGVGRGAETPASRCRPTRGSRARKTGPFKTAQ